MVFSGTGMDIEWSRISALMLYTVRGMWHSTQELPALSTARDGCAPDDRFPDVLVAPRAERVGVGTKLRIAFDLGLVRLDVAIDAGDLALQKALALPQSEGVVGEAARAVVGPVGGVASRRADCIRAPAGSDRSSRRRRRNPFT